MGRGIEHVTGGKGGETGETKGRGIVADFTASFVEEETVVDDLLSDFERQILRRGGTMTATDSQIPAARQAKMWNTSNCLYDCAAEAAAMNTT